jgi:hypothetical protein
MLRISSLGSITRLLELGIGVLVLVVKTTYHSPEWRAAFSVYNIV